MTSPRVVSLRVVSLRVFSVPCVVSSQSRRIVSQRGFHNPKIAWTHRPFFEDVRACRMSQQTAPRPPRGPWAIVLSMVSGAHKPRTKDQRHQKKADSCHIRAICPWHVSDERPVGPWTHPGPSRLDANFCLWKLYTPARLLRLLRNRQK